MLKNKKFKLTLLLVPIFTAFICLSVFPLEIPKDLKSKIEAFQNEVKNEPTTKDTFRDRWNKLKVLYGEQTKHFQNLDVKTEQLRNSARTFSRLSGNLEKEASIVSENTRINPEEKANKMLDEAIMSLGDEKTGNELEKEISKYKSTFPSKKARYSTKYEGGTYNVYFGELHGHSYLSDGINSPYYYYSFSKEITKLDFSALTDHGSYFIKNTAGWSEVFAAADELNEPGKFTALPGVEWSSSYGHGHINLIFFDKPYPEKTLASRVENINSVQKLYKYLDKVGENVVVIRNHTASSRLGSDWGISKSQVESPDRYM